MPLADRGTLTMWSGDRRLGAVLATPRATFTKIAALKGPAALGV